MKKISRRKFIKRGLLFSGAAVMVSPVVLQRYAFTVNNYTIPFNNLPEGFDGFKILHLTDIHCGRLFPRHLVKEVVNMANEINADIIACTGDYVVGRNTIKHIYSAWNELNILEAMEGVYAVLGNHDHWADGDLSLKLMEDSGFSIRHKSKMIVRGNDNIWIGGTGDLWEDELGIDKAFNGSSDKDFKILLAHNPDSADTEFSSRVDLILSGHTHGGQVRLPVIGAPILPVNNKAYAQGLIETDKTKIFISKGIGCSSFPFRVNCYPELALIELKKT